MYRIRLSVFDFLASSLLHLCIKSSAGAVGLRLNGQRSVDRVNARPSGSGPGHRWACVMAGEGDDAPVRGRAPARSPWRGRTCSHVCRVFRRACR